jgi:hypothetical protein
MNFVLRRKSDQGGYEYVFGSERTYLTIFAAETFHSFVYAWQCRHHRRDQDWEIVDYKKAKKEAEALDYALLHRHRYELMRSGNVL